MARIKWHDELTGEKAQFVADVLKESLFDYAFDSDKVPSLNLHYFCKDYKYTFDLVEEGIMKDGNMVPLNEEFENIICNAIWLPEGVSNSLLFFKNKQGFYTDISKDRNINASSKSKYYIENAKYIDGILEADNNNSSLLLSRIEEIINDSVFELKEKRALYYCIREFLSELINLGVNKRYLFKQVHNYLFSYLEPDDDVQYLMTFLKSLLPKTQEYDIVFGITPDVYRDMKDLLEGVRVATPAETQSLGAYYVAENTFDAKDPYSALSLSKYSFSAILSIYNSCKHDINIKVMPDGLVKLSSRNEFSKIKDSKNLVSKNKNKTRPEREEWLKTAIDRKVSRALISSFELHNNALETSDPQTQLLNLWTIIELLIETNQDFMNRSNYISNVLCAVLCNIYYEKILEALFNQIKLSAGVVDVINNEMRGEGNIEKLAFILKDNTLVKSQLLSKIKEYPLEVFKIENLSEILSSKENMKNNLERHSNRLRWQIMRIYRNRCMIIHDGNAFSYLDGIVENQHYYVDELFNYIFKRRQMGITDINAIVAYARIKEQECMQLLSDRASGLSDEDFRKIIFQY